MPLTTTERVRHARQLSLVEIGERGQAQLCAARPRVTPGADRQAAAVALDYLTRAGLDPKRGNGAPVEVAVPSPEQVQALAGDRALVHAASALAGAFAAVEAIKAVLGVGEPAALPPLELATDTAPQSGSP